MSLMRVLETEVMDTAEEAADYDAMDHNEVNARFVRGLLAARESLAPAPGPWSCLDVGTGTARIAIELAKQAPDVVVTAEDLATHMLDVAAINVRAAGFERRIQLRLVDGKAPTSGELYDVIMSNSVVHHMAEPSLLLSAMKSRLKPGGMLYVMDLRRPRSEEELSALVAEHGGLLVGDPVADARTKRQNKLFADSLRAALTVPELLERAHPLGFAGRDCYEVGDRHLLLLARA